MIMLTIRPATPTDASVIVHCIRLLAEYEREPDAVRATEADILRYGFSEDKVFDCLIAEWEHDGVRSVVGFALYFFNYSTWEGRPGLYLEDLFVFPTMRGKGIGKALLVECAKIAVKKNCARFQWQVLDWNTPAIDFYTSLGAQQLTEWITCRVEGDALHALSAKDTYHDSAQNDRATE
jgi:GNAT superfamily N-acetyltransferase